MDTTTVPVTAAGVYSTPTLQRIADRIAHTELLLREVRRLMRELEQESYDPIPPYK